MRDRVVGPWHFSTSRITPRRPRWLMMVENYTTTFVTAWYNISIHGKYIFQPTYEQWNLVHFKYDSDNPGSSKFIIFNLIAPRHMFLPGADPSDNPDPSDHPDPDRIERHIRSDNPVVAYIRSGSAKNYPIRSDPTDSHP
ncbi:hypothetical protein Fcan01_27531 [Folsomia candida]|uniref:Uncharacterized protein n=1 Tax=Folsomia candida TaxID=158441 RepID=A0A226CZB0_FOLCA|nr:hypothetical protein Fcan01_27531 [Folsomia candida]